MSSLVCLLTALAVTFVDGYCQLRLFNNVSKDSVFDHDASFNSAKVNVSGNCCQDLFFEK